MRGVLPRAIEDLITATDELNVSQVRIKLFARFGFVTKMKPDLPPSKHYSRFYSTQELMT